MKDKYVKRWIEAFPADVELKTRRFKELMAGRLNRGAAAIVAGSGEAEDSDEPAYQNLTDALANILHWVDCVNIVLVADGEEQVDFDECLDRARNHHSEERSGEL